MDQLATTEVFRFLAVRPAQLVSREETQRTVIRDERASTVHGKAQLARLARELSVPGKALADWKSLDLGEIEVLADKYYDLVRRYEGIPVGDDLPDGVSLLSDVELSDLGVAVSDQRLVQFTWDSLYTAYATGRDAGQRLEAPTSALRVLHFASILGTDAQPTLPEARRILHAVPAIPTAFHDGFSPAPTTATRHHIAEDGLDDPPDDPERTRRLQGLATELSTTRALLEAATNAPALAIPIAQPDPPDVSKHDGFSRSRFTLTTVPPLRAALPDDLSHTDTALLAKLRIAEITPIPSAVETLQAHMLKLTDQAFELADDRQFQNILRELAAATTPAPKPAIVDQMTSSDVDVSGRISAAIGDLKVVKQTLLAYLPGEVAHIENVLKGERKDRNHRKLDRTETTLFASEEETKDTERDTQSTDRFELKREAEQTIKEDLSLKAGLTVTGTFGPVVTTASGEFAYSTSKQDSQKSSSDFAREVVDRSVNKVQTKTRTERTTKTLSEVEEINAHGVHNTNPGAQHVIGIYRWVDKQYRAQIYNYGPRLLLEFIIPEPAAFYRAADGRRPVKVNVKPPPAFVRWTEPGSISLGRNNQLTATVINETNYQIYAAIYGAAGVTAPPALYKYAGAALVKDGIEPGKGTGVTANLVVPDGYVLQSFNANASYIYVRLGKFALQVGPYAWKPLTQTSSPEGFPELGQTSQGAPKGTEPKDIAPISGGPFAISVAAYDVLSFAVNVQGICKRDDVTYRKWQVETFDKLSAAHQVLQTAYDQAVTEAEAAAGFTFEGQNPASNRIVEKTELKKLCITMMTGQHFSQFHAVTNPPAPPELDINETLHEGPIIQFLEEAFEWEQMTYLFYPYFWGRKKNWAEIFNIHDPDPLFQQFLTAGAARVLVPAPLAYQDAIKFLLQSKGSDLSQKVWGGGPAPTVDSPLHRSIAEELRSQTDPFAGATPEGPSWEFTVPTTLVWLQPDDKLPTF
jgi:hypothetical protein